MGTAQFKLENKLVREQLNSNSYVRKVQNGVSKSS